MTVFTVRHTTAYRYARPVAFGEHRMMLRPREGHDQRLLELELAIEPEPRQLRWLQDVFGNWIGAATFATRAAELRFDSVMRLEHSLSTAEPSLLEHSARAWPLRYSAKERPHLAPWLKRAYPDPSNQVECWTAELLGRAGQLTALELLSTLNGAIHGDFSYVRRMEKGVQSPAATIELRSGSCRDFAVLMIDAVRKLGIAARYVSGYLRVGGRDHHDYVGGGSTHAWMQAYLPGLGWLDFDPTNDIIGNRDLIRTAVAANPAQALPLHGTWTGRSADCLGMSVTVSVTSDDLFTGAETSQGYRYEREQPA